ncbi:MAG: VOC family protein [Chitinophagaceae bacterium]|nr:VOC family protein [Chitinophagaceae bacterium]
MFKKLRTVVYHVSNITEARDWYIRATGIEPYFDEPFYVGFNIDGCELGLDPDMTDVVAGNQAYSYWAVDSTEDAAAKLVEIGGTLIQSKTMVGGDIYVAVVSDPWGNYVGLIEGA